MRVLAFGTYDTATHPRVQVLIDGLRGRGVEVAECNEPLGLDTAARVEMLRQPWKVAGLLIRLASRWTVLARRARRADRADPPDAVLVGYLGHFDVLLARRLFPRATVVLDHLIGAADTARDRGESGSVKGRLLARLDRAALRAADVVVVDTEEHLQTLPADVRHKGIVVLVGAPDAWFAAGRANSAPGSTHPPRPVRVIFFGLYTPLQGGPVIGEALALLAKEPAIEVTMVGRGQDLAATRTAAAANPRVRWLDWLAPDDLPAEVAAHDVCLGIFGTGPKALRVVPNKVYQGTAARTAVVTSDTPPQRRVLGDAALLVPPGDPHALAAALRQLAHDPERLEALRSAASRLAAERFTPAQVVTPLERRLRTLLRMEPTA